MRGGHQRYISAHERTAGAHFTFWAGMGPLSVNSIATQRTSAYADDMKTGFGDPAESPQPGEDIITEMMAIAADRAAIAQREINAVRKARHNGLSWAEIGTLLGVKKQTVHRKYRGLLR